MRRENLLDHDVQRLSMLAGASEVRLRIVQAVEVIDAQAVDHAALDQLEDEPVRAVEHAGSFMRSAARSLTSKKRR